MSGDVVHSGMRDQFGMSDEQKASITRAFGELWCEHVGCSGSRRCSKRGSGWTGGSDE